MRIQYKQEDRREHGCDGCHQSGWYSTEKFEGYCGNNLWLCGDCLRELLENGLNNRIKKVRENISEENIINRGVNSDNAENTKSEVVEKKSEPNYISTCCAFPVHKDQSDEGTFTYVCDCCGKDCNVRNTKSELNSQENSRTNSSKVDGSSPDEIQHELNKDYEEQ